MPREIRFRVWDGEQYVSPDYIGRDGRAYWKENSIPTSSAELEQLAGLWAWLSWDWERLFNVGFAHAACQSWAPRYFSECSDRPLTALWEVALIVGLTVMICGKELRA